LKDSQGKLVYKLVDSAGTAIKSTDAKDIEVTRFAIRNDKDVFPDFTPLEQKCLATVI